MDERDLQTLAGIERYIRGDVFEALALSVGTARRVHPFGVVLAMVDGKERLKAPQPSIFGARGEMATHIQKILRAKAVGLGAAGVIYVDQDGAEVRIRLEHKLYGDHEWTTRMMPHGDNMALAPLDGPKVPAKITRLMPQRTMN